MSKYALNKNMRNSLSLKAQSKVWYNWKPFKNDEKHFLFYVQSSFRFQDI